MTQLQPRETAVEYAESTDGLLPISKEALVQRINTVRKITDEVMEKGVHYAKILGTPKPALLQPGAEVLAATFMLAPHFTVIQAVENFDKPFFMYRVDCSLKTLGTGGFVGSAEAAWNSYESRYWDRQEEKYKQDPYSLQQTGLMMARKRAFVAAVRTATGASELFTQDEDLIPASSGDTEQDAPMGLCPKHNIPFQHKTGTSKKGVPYDFWGCPAKDGNQFCQEKPAAKTAEKPKPPQGGDTRLDPLTTADRKELYALGFQSTDAMLAILTIQASQLKKPTPVTSVQQALGFMEGTEAIMRLLRSSAPKQPTQEEADLFPDRPGS